MTTEALEARRAYRRNWAKANKDKVKAQQERYWSKRAAAAANSADKEKSNDRQRAQDD